MSATVRRSESSLPMLGADARAQKLLDRQVGLIRKGDRALLGLGFAGEILAYAALTPEQLELFATRATAIAQEIRRESRPAPKRKPRAAKPVAISPELVTSDPTPEPTLIELAKIHNRAQIERLRERLALAQSSRPAPATLAVSDSSRPVIPSVFRTNVPRDTSHPVAQNRAPRGPVGDRP